ncbi:(deoxy)nucleoside triphosphate pyrophosphohydrolase [Corallococcus sp. AS-1-6]|uniref:(deoxy)nucleoside triphosphate pyrophosphohydrolase n=1 Tax=unclassified Corallococcus TaxID=2685029 RepID=UPI000ECA6D06|nr:MULTISPECIES: (deoxy)nucleoside triphosphate pyrophosphohydrolase [unclassified Corallococcus]MBZ4329633.1 (deoxy)nucleoside triphosphate pyrophosphohydrolase [Corallococcus sp. AS-1-12]MBZ4373975.1 (deoxy)nucleoside triphosphate pyrophosphohydrolase [Corallococcus sp. AS-1-6]RKH89107.1 (deoxy)nucleoside triphosphate pyrophosphohydrolase [Corallococcus sp. AB045]
MTRAVPRTVRVVAALIPRPGPEDGGPRYLVQQRLPGGSRALLWEFPGGKVEAGETDEAALARECREELDVELSVGRRLWEGRHTYPDLTVELVLFAATLVSGEPKPLGAHQLAFHTPTEMQALPFCEADVPLLDDLLAGRLGALD